ncbi:MAG: dihydropteroate synthase [Salinivirgaceae bacterium]|nr:dihydropteroate synthase [Salinivirgaceae bacterium]
MGIINITPDSFYSASRTINDASILTKVEQMLDDGADIIDLGAYSSRPGAKHISQDEEWERLSKPLELIRKKFPEIVLSVDTFRSSIAKNAVNYFNVDMINDISAGEMDAKMFSTIAELNVPYIIMHMKGNPENMQTNPIYEHLMREVFLYFAKKVETLKSLGVSDIIIDPGFGFGKTIDHNYELLSKLDEFKIFEVPILVGLSRKSMIYKFLNSTPEESLTGTITLNTLALTKGVQILRVHDVKEAFETVCLYNKMKQTMSEIT